MRISEIENTNKKAKSVRAKGVAKNVGHDASVALSSEDQRSQIANISNICERVDCGTGGRK